MKRINLIILTILVISLISCEKDKDVELATISIANEQFVPSYTSASIKCDFHTNGTLSNVYLQYALTADFKVYEERKMTGIRNSFSTQLDSLLNNTIYYIRYAVSNRYSSVKIEHINQFKTLEPSVPTIRIDSIFNIYDTCANGRITLEFDGGAPIKDIGICWSTQPAPTKLDFTLHANDILTVLNLSQLTPNTTYYVRAYAENKKGIEYSNEICFTTLALPQVQTYEITNIQYVSALLKGKLLFNGNDTTTIKGFCWSEQSNPTLDDNLVAIDTLLADFTYLLSNLKDETQYYVRAYAQNRIGVTYGEEITFMTHSVILPIITTNNAYNIDYQSATISASVEFDGGVSVMERGIVYSISQSPTTSNTKVSNSGLDNVFTCDLTYLQENTTYYVRAYATNRRGTAYGNQVSFTTKSKSNGHAYVDLGLSVMWATMNVGASIPEGYGTYFRWGEVYAAFHNEGWDDYAHYNDSTHRLTKYTDGDNNGSGDNKTQLELSDDAARVNWGGAWRMPTVSEWRELMKQCSWSWISQNGTSGYKVTSRKNGNSIFLPAAGGYNGRSHFFQGGLGYYWSSSIYTGISGWHRAWHLNFNSSNVSLYEEYRIDGLSVRPVFQ